MTGMEHRHCDHSERVIKISKQRVCSKICTRDLQYIACYILMLDMRRICAGYFFNPLFNVKSLLLFAV